MPKCRIGQQRALVFEEPLFAIEAAAVAVEAACGVDDAVAGDDDRDGIGTVGGTDGTSGVGRAESACEIAVGGGCAIGDMEERGPDSLLERSADGSKGKIEAVPRAGEVLVELGMDAIEEVALGGSVGVVGGGASMPTAWKLEESEADIDAGEEIAQWRGEDLGCKGVHAGG